MFLPFSKVLCSTCHLFLVGGCLQKCNTWVSSYNKSCRVCLGQASRILLNVPWTDPKLEKLQKQFDRQPGSARPTCAGY